MVTMKEFTQGTPKPLPVILLADVSGSMAGNGKIQALNQAVREMLSSFAGATDVRGEIQVCVITFGGEARVHMPLQAAKNVNWSDMQADGGTPMGRAMEIAADLIEDRGAIPSRAYRPTVVLVSDGQPTDEWAQGLDRLAKQGRAQKAVRIALAIGADADEAMLAAFLGDSKMKVFHAEDAKKIGEFFNWLTIQTLSRSRSSNPNQPPPMGDPFAVGKF